MTYRPYPSVDRALRQLRRRAAEVQAPAQPHWSKNAAVVVGMSGLEAAELLRRWRAAGQPAPRSPRVVGDAP